MIRGRRGDFHAGRARRAESPRRILISFWTLVFCFYAASGTGHSSFGDGFLLLQTARSLLDHGTLTIPDSPAGGSARKKGSDGRWYAVFGPGLVFAYLPALVVGRTLPILQPDTGESLLRDEFWAQLTNAWIMATVVLLIARCGLEIGASRRAAFLVAGMAAAASPLWLYARIDSTEALQALGLIGATCFLMRSRRREGRVAPLASGAMLGVAIAAKVVNVLLVPWFLAAAFAWAPSSGRLRRVLFLALPVSAVLSLIGLYDYARFGDPLETGYLLRFTHSALGGAATLLFLPSYGLFWFWPAFPLAAIGALVCVRRFPGETFLAGAVLATLAATYSGWWAYWGMAWGPRFLVPAIPLLALLLLPLAERPSRFATAALALAGLAGIAVQTMALASGYGRTAFVQMRVRVSDPHERYVDARIAPLRIGAWWIHATIADHWRGREAADEILREPPWKTSHPWRRAGGPKEDLSSMLGLDLWIVPASWRMPYRNPLAGHPEPRTAPSNPGLAALLLSGILVSAALLAREIRHAHASTG